jgi:hypothetical protein
MFTGEKSYFSLLRPNISFLRGFFFCNLICQEQQNQKIEDLLLDVSVFVCYVNYIVRPNMRMSEKTKIFSKRWKTATAVLLFEKYNERISVQITNRQYTHNVDTTSNSL